MLLSLPKTWHLSRAKLLLIGLLLVLALTALPSYGTGQWRWKQPPNVATLKALREVRQHGLALGAPANPTAVANPASPAANPTPAAANPPQSGPQMVTIGEHKWLQQEILLAGKAQPALLLLLPQNSHTQQPQVEWMDIDGAQRWRSDAVETVNFGVPSGTTVSARWFRAWTRSQTYAVLQWYAQPTGSSPSPSAWFVADRLAQWQNRRVPWVAVSLLVPIGPLEELPQVRPSAEALAVSIQTALLQAALKS
jgi:cyanoexosortase B-associated protein